MDKERNHIHISFSYTDRFGNIMSLNKKLGTENIELNPDGEFGFLLDQFKIFLRSCEFNDESIDTIQWKI